MPFRFGYWSQVYRVVPFEWETRAVFYRSNRERFYLLHTDIIHQIKNVCPLSCQIESNTTWTGKVYVNLPMKNLKSVFFFKYHKNICFELVARCRKIICRGTGRCPVWIFSFSYFSYFRPFQLNFPIKKKFLSFQFVFPWKQGKPSSPSDLFW